MSPSTVLIVHLRTLLFTVDDNDDKETYCVVTVEMQENTKMIECPFVVTYVQKAMKEQCIMRILIVSYIS